MSEFMKNVNIITLDRLRASRINSRMVFPYDALELSVDHRSSIVDYAEEYMIEAAYRRKVICRSEDLELARRNFLKGLNAAVYQDFINLLIVLESALYAEDIEQAREIVKKLWSEAREF